MGKNSCFTNQYFNIGYNISDIALSPMKFEMHIHDLYELYYFLQGDVTYYIEGQGYKIEAGDLLIINSKELHKPIFNSNRPYERIVIHFVPWYIKKYNTDDFNLLTCFEDRKAGQYNKISKDSIINYKINRHFKQIIDYINSNERASAIMIETLFIQLLVLINKIFKKQDNLQLNSTEYDEKVLNIINYINDNLNKKITLDLLAREFFLNKFYLSHLFKENTGFSILQYINYKKIMKAKELLSHGLTCSEVCNRLNFGDYSNFYKTFKKNVGSSPLKYKQNNLIT